MECSDFLALVTAGNAVEVKAALDNDPKLALCRNEQDLSALMLSIYYGRAEIRELILLVLPELSIFEASAAGELEQVRQRIEQDKENPNGWAPDGFQPLGLAAFFGHLEVARFLIDRGAEVNSPARNPMHVMPLHSAVAGGHQETVKLLLEHGAEVDARQAGGFTPLHAAAQNGDVAIIDLLLQFGADPGAVSEDHRDAYEYALQSGHPEAAQRLQVD